MATTSTPRPDLLCDGSSTDSITHQIVLPHVTWTTYQALLADMGEQRASRLTYDQGILEIRMPSKLHEVINRLLERIVNVLTEELGMHIIALGSSTVESEEMHRGVEPDSCFYIQKALQVDPLAPTVSSILPLDLVIEVDITSTSSRRLEVYKHLQVAEVWRYTRQEVQILQLQRGAYEACTHSPTFPMLSAAMLWHFVEQGRVSQDFNSVNRAVRTWLHAWQETQAGTGDAPGQP